MLSIANVSKGQAVDYYLKSNSYYLDSNAKKEWYGKGADKLSLLSKEFNDNDYINLANGKIFLNNKEINLSNGRKDRAIGIDLTFSAPKSVSLMCELKDKELENMHKEAVKTTLAYIEKEFQYSRVKDDDGIKFKKMDNAVVSIFTENTSREMEPQIHSHCIWHNITFDKDNNYDHDHIRATYLKDIFNNKKHLGAIYRNELAKLVSKKYEIEFDKNKYSFEIKGVDKELIKEFSTRRKQIEEKLAEFETKDGKTAALANKISRKSKAKNIDEHSLKEIWQKRIVDKGYTLDNIKPIEKTNIGNNLPDLKASIQNAIDHLSERNAIFKRQDLIETIQKNNFGIFTIKDIETELKKTGFNLFYNAPTKEYTTLEQITKEDNIIKMMNNGKNKFEYLLPKSSISPHLNKESYKNMTEEQKQTVSFILENKDRFMAVQGFAGVGKTYAVQELNKIMTENGLNILGLAPTNKSTNELKEAKIEAITLQKFLKQYDGYANNRGSEEGLKIVREQFKKTVILLDEASLADTKQIHNLFTIAEKLDIRVILQGDKMQLDAVNAGTPFKQLQKQGISQTEMKNIQRQKDLNLREAVKDTINKNIESVFARLDKNIIEVKENKDFKEAAKNNDNAINTKDLIANRTVQEYMQLPEQEREKTLILTLANETKKQVTAILRQELIKENEQKEAEKLKSLGIAGKLINKIKETLEGKEIKNTSIEVIEQKSLTAAEKKNKQNYEIGNVILFSKDYKSYDIEKNVEYKIVNIDKIKNEITVKSDSDKEIKINLDKAKNFNLFENKNLPLQKGEELKWTKTCKKLNINKSDSLKLKEINETSLTFIDKKNNKEITFLKNDPILKNLDYNYPTTAYSAQGLTSNNIIAVVESYRVNLTNQKSFYVELSRSKYSCKIITDDKEKTLNQLTKNTGEKSNALEIFDKARTEKVISDRMELNIKSESRVNKTKQNKTQISKNDRIKTLELDK